jgi:hypothetical protein
MSATSFTIRLCLVTLAFAGVAFLAAPDAKAITYGERDCADNTTNTDCRHPNTVQLTQFGYRGGSRLIANGRATGTLLAEDADRFIILTAGHVASGMLDVLQRVPDAEIGVSFDAKIVRDMPWIGVLANSPRQSILGGQPVLNREFGPHNNANGNEYDYAVFVFDIPEASRFTADRWGRPRGKYVDLSEISPVNLPELDYLRDKVHAAHPLPLVTVGYGLGELLNGPGEGGNQWGPMSGWDKLGERWMTNQTPAFHFMGKDHNMLGTSQNPAKGDEGSGNGDSGGPLFHVTDQGVEIQVAVTAAGDVMLRAHTINARIDTADAIEFLDCVMAPDAELEDILACGCTEVNDKGVCPAE